MGIGVRLQDERGEMESGLHLERIRAAVRDDEDLAVLDAVRTLAERCRDGIHLCLRFIGD